MRTSSAFIEASRPPRLSMSVDRLCGTSQPYWYPVDWLNWPRPCLSSRTRRSKALSKPVRSLGRMCRVSGSKTFIQLCARAMKKSYDVLSPRRWASCAIAKSSMEYSRIREVAKSPLRFSIIPVAKYWKPSVRVVDVAGRTCVEIIDAWPSPWRRRRR
nr:hypothetical protein [Nonomuraea sp. SYSU D8015]